MPSKKEGAKLALDSDWKKTSREVLETVLANITKLWNAHFPVAKTILDDSENSILNINFAVKMDFSESELQTETKIRYSEVHTDSKVDTFENPRPGPELPGEPLPGVDEAAKSESKKARAKARAAREGADGESAHITQSAE